MSCRLTSKVCSSCSLHMALNNLILICVHTHVCAGGGLLGIAHVGFVCILEEAGVRFRGIGGTSAGAINAIILAASRKDDKGKSDPSQESWERTLTASPCARACAWSLYS